MTSVLSRHNVNLSGNEAGQPMMFAHGFGCDQNMWRLVVPAFSDDFRIVLFDHTGFGGSQLSAWDAVRHGDLHTYAAEVLELIRALDLSDVIFVGHSVSSMIGVLAANEEPERFAELILVGPSPRYIDDPADNYRGGFSADDIDQLLDSLESNYLGWSGAMAPVIMGNPSRPMLGEELRNSFCRTDPSVASAFARATFLSDNRADLPAVRVPSLVLQCSADPIAPDEVGAYVAEHIPEAELVTLAATGHCPNLSAPEETAQAIRTYLNRRRGSRD